MTYRILAAFEDATYGGVYYSGDFETSGAQPTWTKYPNTGLFSNNVYQMAVDPAEPFDVIYVQQESGRTYRYNALTSNWTLIMDLAAARVITGRAGPNDRLSGLCTNPLYPGRVYVGYGELTAGTTGGVLYSSDYGATWNWYTPSGCCLGYEWYVQAYGDNVWFSGPDPYGSIWVTRNHFGAWSIKNPAWGSTGAPIAHQINPHSPDSLAYGHNRSVAVQFYDLQSLAWNGAAWTNTLQQDALDLARLFYYGVPVRFSTGDASPLWINPNTAGHQRILRNGIVNGLTMFRTTDDWSTVVDAAPPNFTGDFPPSTVSQLTYARNLYSPIVSGGSVDPDVMVFAVNPFGTGAHAGEYYHKIYVIPSETDFAVVGRGGPNYNNPPYVDSLPGNVATFYPAKTGIYIEEIPPPAAELYYISLPLEKPVGYNFWLCDDAGVRIYEFTESVRSATIDQLDTDQGGFTINLDPEIDRSMFRRDTIIQIYRMPTGNYSKRLMVGFVTGMRLQTDENGNDYFTIYGLDEMSLLDRAIIAYRENSAYSEKTGPIDDVMKEYFDENLGASAFDPNRIRAGFSVSANLSLGTNATYNGSFTELLRVLQDLYKQSVDAGTPIYFRLEYQDNTQFVFNTYVNQLGHDRRSYDGINPFVFSQDYESLEEPDYFIDYSEEKNYIYGGGQGLVGARILDEQSDPVSIAGSLWGRREGFVNVNRSRVGQVVTDQTLTELERRRPVWRFSARLKNTKYAVFGKDWFLGDIVTAIYKGIAFDGRVKGYTIELSDDGTETVNAYFEVSGYASV